jgi:hypothetical protein
MTAWKHRKRRLPNDRIPAVGLVGSERSSAMKIATKLVDAILARV